MSELFDGKPKSVIVIGGADSLTYSRLGYKIDKFDIVVRVNCALTDGYEIDVGKKFDIWTTCDNIIPERCSPWDFGFGHYFYYMKEKGYDEEYIKKCLTDLKEIWYATWDNTALRRVYKDNSLLKKYNLYFKIKRHQSIPSSDRCIRETDSKQTTGFAVIWLLNKMFDRVYIAGFSYAPSDIEGYKPHYYNESRLKIDYKDYLLDASKLHRWESERKYIAKEIGKGNIVDLNHIVDIVKGNPLYETEEYICKSCKAKNKIFEWQDKKCIYCEKDL